MWTYPATSLTISRTKAVRLLRRPLDLEILGLETRGVVFCNGEKKTFSVSVHRPRNALNWKAGRDPPRGETYMTAVDADGEAGPGRCFLGHLFRFLLVAGRWFWRRYVEVG